MSQVSIIIPTLNEANCLGRTLQQLKILEPQPLEVLIVDGGSQDETIDIAEAAGVPVLSCATSGRSIQMNEGARQAKGDILCFLHADTGVPDDLIAVIRQTLANPAVACGGFIALMTGAYSTRWGISLHNYLKTYYAPLLFRPYLFVRGLRLLFGDQVIFCRRTDFWDCGGFGEQLSIMEDGDLCLRLVQKGKIRQVNRIVQSSDRRVAHWGAWKATVIYLTIGCLWGIGVPAKKLKQFYEDIR